MRVALNAEPPFEENLWGVTHTERNLPERMNTPTQLLAWHTPCHLK